MKIFFKITHPVFFLALLFCLAATKSSDEGKPFPRTKLLPVDQSAEDPDFYKFRNQFLEAVKRKDLDFLLAHVDQDIKCSFGGCGTIPELKEYWHLDQEPGKSNIWSELTQIILLGGVFSEYENGEKAFMAPYVYVNFPSTFDSFEDRAVIADKVNVRAEPSSKSEIVDVLSYDIVKTVNRNPDELTFEEIRGEKYPWVEVIIYSGKRGFIFGKYVRSPVDYRVAFVKNDGSWEMVFFVSGD